MRLCIVVEIDPTQLSQLFQNLIANAIKFRATAPPQIHVSAQPEQGRWRFSVRDNGIGIEQAFADRIFTIFQRLHTIAEYPGTGIGLAICKRIVERHGGRIWVESEPAPGPPFTSRCRRAAHLRSLRDMENGEIHILVVEDNPGDIRLIQEALLECGMPHRMAVATDGVAALRYLRPGAFAPGHAAAGPHPAGSEPAEKNGREVLAEIKSDPALRRIPVVVLSSSRAEEDILAAYDRLANCYICKPLDLDAFFEVTEAILRFWAGTVGCRWEAAHDQEIPGPAHRRQSRRCPVDPGDAFRSAGHHVGGDGL